MSPAPRSAQAQQSEETPTRNGLAEYLHAKSFDGVKQEAYAFGLFIGLSRLFMASASESANVPFPDLSQKRAILAVAAYVTRILLLKDRAKLERIVGRLLDRIARNIDPPRPGRSYPRRSFRPRPRWHATGKC